MDYFNDVLTTFLGLDQGSSIVVYAVSESSWITLKNILNCVPKMILQVLQVWNNLYFHLSK